MHGSWTVLCCPSSVRARSLAKAASGQRETGDAQDLSNHGSSSKGFMQAQVQTDGSGETSWFWNAPKHGSSGALQRNTVPFISHSDASYSCKVRRAALPCLPAIRWRAFLCLYLPSSFAKAFQPPTNSSNSELTSTEHKQDLLYTRP